MGLNSENRILILLPFRRQKAFIDCLVTQPHAQFIENVYPSQFSKSSHYLYEVSRRNVKFMRVMFKNSVPASQKSLCISITNTARTVFRNVKVDVDLVRRKSMDISDEHIASIFRIEE
jgi:hypothetical protein